MLRTGVDTGQLIGRNPLWTTGDRFIFRGCNTWQTGRAGDCGLWVMPGNGGAPAKLSAHADHIPTDVHNDLVLYSSSETGDWNVYAVNIASKEMTQLTFDPAADGLATISPDGRSVAFLSDRNGRLAVWTVAFGQNAPTLLFEIPPEWGGVTAESWSEEKLSWAP
jgi:hypothetical protein